MDAPKRTIDRARSLRKQMTAPEVRLWNALRKGGAGVRFRKQHPLGPYILDFYCPEARLCVEVDGWSHNMGDPTRDERRDAWLASQGVRVLRIPATVVLHDVQDAFDAVVGALRAPFVGFADTSPKGGR